MNKEKITKLRLLLLENGYAALPNLDKRILLSVWPIVEVPRQVGSFGPHTVNNRGEVVVNCEWSDGPTPSTIPLSDLQAWIQTRLEMRAQPCNRIETEELQLSRNVNSGEKQ